MKIQQQQQYKFDTPLGEKVLRFTSKTPERFRSKVGLYYSWLAGFRQ